MNEENERKMLQEIHSAVIGNEQLGHEGLVKKVKRHEDWIASATIKGAAVVGGSAVVVFLIEMFFRK